ncbi:disease resistance protein RPS5-like [Fagus crenata]
MEPKKKFWRKNGGGCSFLKLWTKSKLTKQLVVATCPEYTSMQRHTLRILRCMPDVTTIGVHGIGGIGKTSVLKAVVDFPPINSCLMWLFGTIVEKCHGLPLLIIVTGRALAKENDAFAWRHALKEFSHRNGIYKKLQFSFDRLESLELKSCFLYCALFPEDRKLRIIELRLEGGLSIKMHDLIRDFVSIWLDRQVD